MSDHASITRLHVLAAEGDINSLYRYWHLLHPYLNSQSDTGDTPLHFAARYSKAAAVSFLLDHDARVNIRNSDGQTPLHEAARHNADEVIKMIVADGNASHVADGYGNFPIHYAARYCGRLVLEALDGQLNYARLADKHGALPIHLAASHDNVDALAWFIGVGIGVDTRDVDGNVLNLLELELSPVGISINPMGGRFHERWSNTASFLG